MTREEIERDVRNAMVEVEYGCLGTSCRKQLLMRFSLRDRVYVFSGDGAIGIGDAHPNADIIQEEFAAIHAALEAMPEEEWEWESDLNRFCLIRCNQIVRIIDPVANSFWAAHGGHLSLAATESLCRAAECLFRHGLHRRYERAN